MHKILTHMSQVNLMEEKPLVVMMYQKKQREEE